MERSTGKIRGDVAHDKLVAVGYSGGPDRTLRRAVAAVGKDYRPRRARRTCLAADLAFGAGGDGDQDGEAVPS